MLSGNRSLGFIALLSLLVPALTQAAPSPDPLRFRKDVDALIATAHSEEVQQGGVICVGSSSMRMWHDRIRDDLAPLSVVPMGFGGSLFSDVNFYFDELIAPLKPRAIVIYEGDNDIGVGKSITQILRDFLTFVDKVETLDPSIRIYVISVKPSGARWSIWPDMRLLNERLKMICDAYPQLQFVDVASVLLDSDGFVRPEYFIQDNLHLSQAGYDRWAEAVRQVVVPAERRFEKQAAK